MKRVYSVVTMLAAGIILGSCSEDSETARLVVRLTDAPGDYEAVNVDIEKVLIHRSETASEGSNGWMELELAGIEEPLNLLELSNGVDTLLAQKEMPTGKISQIRLVLGDDNSVRVDGEDHSLKTPSGQQSGLKVQVHADLTPGIIYEIKLDFDAAQSIVSTGSGEYSLKPVIRSIVEAQSGAISGTVNDTSDLLTIVAVSDEGEQFSAFTTEEGQFLIQGIPPGTYSIEIRNTSGLLIQTMSQVEVELGEVYDLETIELIGQ